MWVQRPSFVGDEIGFPHPVFAVFGFARNIKNKTQFFLNHISLVVFFDCPPVSVGVPGGDTRGGWNVTLVPADGYPGLDMYPGLRRRDLRIEGVCSGVNRGRGRNREISSPGGNHGQERNRQVSFASP